MLVLEQVFPRLLTPPDSGTDTSDHGGVRNEDTRRLKFKYGFPVPRPYCQAPYVVGNVSSGRSLSPINIGTRIHYFGRVRVECSGSSLQPLGNGVQQAESSDPITLPGDRGERRNQTDREG